jgi:hypothetical protein
MKDNSYGGTAGGIGFCGVLAIVFIVLKLCKVISWSWLWVTAPIWIPAAIGITALIVYVIVSLVTAIFRR